MSRPLRRVVAVLGPEQNLTGAIYGTITAGAILAVESSYRQTLRQAIGALVLTLVLYWLAHAYAALLSQRLRTGARWSGRNLVDALRHEWPIVQGAFAPVAVLVAATAAGASVRTAEVTAMASAAVLVVVLEVVAGRRTGLRGTDAAVQVVAGVILGLGVLALKAVLK